MKYYTKVHEKEYEIEIDHENEIVVNGERYAIDFQKMPDAGLASLLIRNHSFEAVIEEHDEFWEVLIQGQLYGVRVQDERTYRLSLARGTAVDGGVDDVHAPMPGIIIAVPVKVGDRVAQGDKVVILESMKMENELRAPRGGVISQVLIEPGASVEKDAVLVIIEEENEE